ncbi:hypothetical protein [Tunturiibacter gelidoferens]|uniref:Uncharacterized protein n=1 Tax=Tunturiibacter gelidiferens TaxID=3069689 RepID=A0A9X0QJZ1_9BACT|nr:hypothetical protein [Edaphobacter lichenicola]MBB5331684.1 hypothetical protein [Edaphobacter lichenicola]
MAPLNMRSESHSNHPRALFAERMIRRRTLRHLAYYEVAEVAAILTTQETVDAELVQKRHF